MKIFKKIYRFLSSMPLAITLLILLAAACALCSGIQQGQDLSWYVKQYGERTGAFIFALHADDAYHSWWFLILSGFLCVSLLLCNLIRVRQLAKRTKKAQDVEAILCEKENVSCGQVEDPKSLFEKMKMPAPREVRTADGREALAAYRNTAGIWGAWICHLGILLLIIGFALGQSTQEEYTVIGAHGQTKPLGETGYQVTVNDFRIDWREDGTAGQYTADLTVADARGNLQHGEASVNHPAELFGYEFIQNSTGWAADVRILKNGQQIQQETLCVQEYIPLADDPDIVVMFYNFYPNYDKSSRTPVAAGGRPENPGYVYMVFYQGELKGMDVLTTGDEITIDNQYTVIFENPSNYTLLVVKKDRFAVLAMIGGLVTLLGLILAFYLRPESMWAIREEDGRWTVYGRSVRGSVMFKDRFAEAAGPDETIREEEKHPANAEKDSGA